MICVRLPCHLRQVMCHVASNHAPICIKKRAVLRQVAIVLSYSCVAISPFQSSFPIFSAFYFPVSCFSIPVFFQMFFDKVCTEIIYLWFSHSCFYKLNSHGFYILKCRAMLVEWVSVLSYHRISEYNLGRECLKQLINMIRLLLIPFRHSLYPKTSEHQEMLHHSLFW